MIQKPSRRQRAPVHLVLVGALFATLPAWPQGTAAEVTKVDKAQHKLTLRHEAIPSLNMPAMTMAYRVQDPRWLEQVQPGSRVKFDADKVNGQYVVIRLSVEPAR